MDVALNEDLLKILSAHFTGLFFDQAFEASRVERLRTNVNIIKQFARTLKCYITRLYDYYPV